MAIRGTNIKDTIAAIEEFIRDKVAHVNLMNDGSRIISDEVDFVLKSENDYRPFCDLLKKIGLTFIESPEDYNSRSASPQRIFSILDGVDGVTINSASMGYMMDKGISLPDITSDDRSHLAKHLANLKWNVEHGKIDMGYRPKGEVRHGDNRLLQFIHSDSFDIQDMLDCMGIRNVKAIKENEDISHQTKMELVGFTPIYTQADLGNGLIQTDIFNDLAHERFIQNGVFDGKKFPDFPGREQFQEKFKNAYTEIVLQSINSPNSRESGFELE